MIRPWLWLVLLTMLLGCSQSSSTEPSQVTSSAPCSVQPQAWLGIIESCRAIDWSGAGVEGGIPTRTTICATLDNSATEVQINAAIQACPAGQVVKLNAGTYTVGGISFGGKSNVTLRGAGPDQTIIKSIDVAGWHASAISMEGPGTGRTTYFGEVDAITAERITNWTGGYAKGSTVLTVDSTTGIQVGQVVVVDQIDDTVDTGGITQANITTGFSPEGCPCPGRTKSSDPGYNPTPSLSTHRTQQQFLKVVSLDATHITVTPPLYMNNWRAGQDPEVWWWASGTGGTISMSGVEDLTIDGTSIGGVFYNIGIENGYNNWVKNVRSINSPRGHVGMVQSARNEVRNSYFYLTHNGASQSYGIESFGTSDDLVINNIFHNVTTPTMGPSPGSVIAFNYSIDMTFTINTSVNTMAHFGTHDSGGGMTLYEGNQTNGWIADIPHGNSPLTTLFRNHFRGRDESTTFPKNQAEIPIVMHAFSRANNVVGNVLGTSGYHSIYEWSNGPQGDTSNEDRSIYVLDREHSAGIPQDNLVFSSLLRWGNFDTVTGAVRWNALEIPTAGITYVNGNPVPASQTLPASFFLSAKPSWWGSPYGTPAWPPIGPDVTGGDHPDLGLGGRVWQIPARLCYFNSPIDINYPDGADRGVLLFNADACYS